MIMFIPTQLLQPHSTFSYQHIQPHSTLFFFLNIFNPAQRFISTFSILFNSINIFNLTTLFYINIFSHLFYMNNFNLTQHLTFSTPLNYFISTFLIPHHSLYQHLNVSQFLYQHLPHSTLLYQHLSTLPWVFQLFYINILAST